MYKNTKVDIKSIIFLEVKNMEYNKDWLIREVAHRADFTIGDIKLVWSTIEDVIKEVLHNEDTLMIKGLFRVYVKTIRPRRGCAKGYTPINGGEFKGAMLPEAKRIYASWSRELLKPFREDESDIGENEEAME